MIKKKSDCALYGDVPTTFINLLPGQFVIVYPEDPHAPAIGKRLDTQTDS